MDSQKTTAFMPELVQEVADFKKFLNGYQHDGANKLIGLGEMHLFKFYVEKGDDMGWPVMRYKVCSQFLRISIYPFFEWKYMPLSSIALSDSGCRRSADTSVSYIPAHLFLSRSVLLINLGYPLARLFECGVRTTMVLPCYRKVFLLPCHFSLFGGTLWLILRRRIRRKS